MRYTGVHFHEYEYIGGGCVRVLSMNTLLVDEYEYAWIHCWWMSTSMHEYIAGGWVRVSSMNALLVDEYEYIAKTWVRVHFHTYFNIIY